LAAFIKPKTRHIHCKQSCAEKVNRNNNPAMTGCIAGAVMHLRFICFVD